MSNEEAWFNMTGETLQQTFAPEVIWVWENAPTLTLVVSGPDEPYPESAMPYVPLASAARLQDALEQLIIAIFMGWDLDDIVEEARAALAEADQ